MKENTLAAHPPQRMGGAQWLSLIAGLAAAGITAANLTADAIASRTFGLEQINAVVLLTATISFGIVAKAMAAQRRFGYATAFYVVFTAGTLLVVYNSVGRQHGTAEKAVAAVANANSTFHELEADKKRVDDRIAGLKTELGRYASVRSATEIQAALDAVVGAGKGRVPADVWRRTKSCAATETTRPDSAEACKPAFDLREENGRAITKGRLIASIEKAETERSKLSEKIEQSGGERPVPATARGFAEFAGLLGYSPERVEYVLSRLDKVLLALFLEVGAVFGIEFGLAGLLHPATVADDLRNARKQRATVMATVDDDAPPTPPNGGNRRLVIVRHVATVDAARADVIQLVRRGEPLPAQDLLARRWGVHKGTTSKWLSRFEAEGIITRRAEGRRKAVAAA